METFKRKYAVANTSPFPTKHKIKQLVVDNYACVALLCFVLFMLTKTGNLKIRKHQNTKQTIGKPTKPQQ